MAIQIIRVYREHVGAVRSHLCPLTPPLCADEVAVWQLDELRLRKCYLEETSRPSNGTLAATFTQTRSISALSNL